MLRKIISGGQTGVDRAALDAAIKMGLPHGGWIPKGRQTEAGPLPPEYQMLETDSIDYADRTARNVEAADATLILSRGPLTGGSALTLRLAQRNNRPCLHIDLTEQAAFQAAVDINKWLGEKQIEILNVAGPRASKDPSIYATTLKILETVLSLELRRLVRGPNICIPIRPGQGSGAVAVPGSRGRRPHDLGNAAERSGDTGQYG